MKTIVLVCDDVNNHGNGTSNSARQFAEELQRRGFEVRLVGIGAPEFSVREQLWSASWHINSACVLLMLIRLCWLVL